MNGNKEKPQYSQKVFDLLADKEFREFLNLQYKDSKGNFSIFRKEIIQNLGANSEDFIDLFFFIVEKNYP